MKCGSRVLEQLMDGRNLRHSTPVTSEDVRPMVRAAGLFFGDERSRAHLHLHLNQWNANAFSLSLSP